MVMFQMGYTALLRACSQGLLDVVKVLLEAGCNVDFADEVSNNYSCPSMCPAPTGSITIVSEAYYRR
jgi:hypothetical protein